MLGELGRSWDRLGFPAISSGYFRRIAEAAPVRTPDQRSLPLLRCLQALGRFHAPVHDGAAGDRVVWKGPRDQSRQPRRQTDLGICYAEGTTTPMQGIMLLREVVEKNPGIANAQFNLRILSCKVRTIRQGPRALFKVLEIDPKRTLARFMIGRVPPAGAAGKALAALEQVKKKFGSAAVERGGSVNKPDSK